MQRQWPTERVNQWATDCQGGSATPVAVCFLAATADTSACVRPPAILPAISRCLGPTSSKGAHSPQYPPKPHRWLTCRTRSPHPVDPFPVDEHQLHDPQVLTGVRIGHMHSPLLGRRSASPFWTALISSLALLAVAAPTPPKPWLRSSVNGAFVHPVHFFCVTACSSQSISLARRTHRCCSFPLICLRCANGNSKHRNMVCHMSGVKLDVGQRVLTAGVSRCSTGFPIFD